MAGLRADKMALAERVTRLEKKDCDETWAEDKHEPKQKEDEGMEAQLTQRTTVYPPPPRPAGPGCGAEPCCPAYRHPAGPAAGLRLAAGAGRTDQGPR